MSSSRRIDRTVNMSSDYNNQQLGMFLKQAREEAGLSRMEAAASLKLLRNQLHAIEDGEFHKLPGDTFVVGYLKNYARLVGLNPEEFANQYRLNRREEDKEPAQNVAEHTVPADLTMNMGLQHKQHKTAYGLVLSVLVALSVWWFAHQSEPQAVDYSDNIVRVDTAEGTTVIGPLTEYAEEEIDIAPPSPLQISTVTTMGDISPANNVQDDSSVEIVQDSRLSFYFTGDCWVEVRDGDEQIIYASLKKADEMLQLRGKPPFRVILGYAPAVSLSYNGEPVDIDAHRRDNMAKLILGNS